MLNVFSSKMTNDEEMKMMHILWMIANQWGNRNWSESGYPQRASAAYQLGGTPLNEAVIAMMKIVPKFKNETGVQKVHSVFLTDGAGNNLNNKHEWKLNTYESSETYGEQVLSTTNIHGKCVITDPVTNKTIKTEDRYWNTTPILLELLKNRIPKMNVVGFFVAGSGKHGKVKSDTLRYAVDGWRNKYGSDEDIRKALADLNKNNVFVAKSKGYDEYYILPSIPKVDESDEEGIQVKENAKTGDLKRAFAKFSKSKTLNRQLLNKFIAQVA